jgi:hypothetical protein
MWRIGSERCRDRYGDHRNRKSARDRQTADTAHRHADCNVSSPTQRLKRPAALRFPSPHLLTVTRA